MLSGTSVKPQWERHNTETFHSRELVAIYKAPPRVLLGPVKPEHPTADYQVTEAITPELDFIRFFKSQYWVGTATIY